MKQRLPADPRVYDRTTPTYDHPLVSALLLVLVLVGIVVAITYPVLAVGVAIGLLARPVWRVVVARGRSATESVLSGVRRRLPVSAGSISSRRDRRGTADGTRRLVPLDPRNGR